ncbi:hypothetical protein HSISS3_1342 [Streptococcus sp. HSISS3]|nr:hypothetical protein HSISS3_1342 [Streptococcus sp. HSISS3]
MTAIVELKDATVKVNNGFDTEKQFWTMLISLLGKVILLLFSVEMVPENQHSLMSLQEPSC